MPFFGITIVKDGCLTEVLAGVSGLFAAICRTFIHPEIFEVHFDCGGSQNHLLVVLLVVQSRLFVTGTGDRSGFRSMY